MSASALRPATTSHTDPLVAERASITHVGLFLAAAGLGFVVVAVAAPGALRALYELLASPGTPTTMDLSVRFGAALFGALTVGWGATIHQLGQGHRLRAAVMRGAIVWFVIDSAASVLLGYAWNAVSNVGFMVVVGLLLRRGTRDVQSR